MHAFQFPTGPGQNRILGQTHSSSIVFEPAKQVSYRGFQIPGNVNYGSYDGSRGAVVLNRGVILNSYQMGAIEWMNGREKNLVKGGILCAEPGLGKTVMCLYRIAEVKHRGPSLYVCGKTLLKEVVNELEKFFNQPGATQLRYLVLHPDHTTIEYINNLTAINLQFFDVVITTYEVVVKSAGLTNAFSNIVVKLGANDTKILGYKQPNVNLSNIMYNVRGVGIIHSYPWNLKILDEAQCINYVGTEHFKSATSITSYVTICSSGTPIRNNEDDIWSQLFACGYSNINNPNNWDRTKFVGDVKNMLYFIDYTMAGVILPGKTVVNYELDMSEKEHAIYSYYLNGIRNRYIEYINGKGTDTPSKKYKDILGRLTILKLICISPWLTTPESKIKKNNMDIVYTDLVTSEDPAVRELENHVHNVEEMGFNATKIAKAVSIIDGLIVKVEEDNRIIVFSSYLSALYLLAGALDKKYPNQKMYRILSGVTSSQDRELYIKEFFQGKFPIFLMVFKVGGVGINLQCANHVIHIDYWWNEIVELQADARAHRMGQTRHVYTHKLIINKSIEKIIKEIAAKKSYNASFYYGKNNTKLYKMPKLDKESLTRILYQSEDIKIESIDLSQSFSTPLLPAPTPPIPLIRHTESTNNNQKISRSAIVANDHKRNKLTKGIPSNYRD